MEVLLETDLVLFLRIGLSETLVTLLNLVRKRQPLILVGGVRVYVCANKVSAGLQDISIDRELAIRLAYHPNRPYSRIHLHKICELKVCQFAIGSGRKMPGMSVKQILATDFEVLGAEMKYV